MLEEGALEAEVVVEMVALEAEVVLMVGVPQQQQLVHIIVLQLLNPQVQLLELEAVHIDVMVHVEQVQQLTSFIVVLWSAEDLDLDQSHVREEQLEGVQKDHFEQVNEKKMLEMAGEGEEEDFVDAMQKLLQPFHNTQKGMSFVTADDDEHAPVLYHVLVWKEA